MNLTNKICIVLGTSSGSLNNFRKELIQEFCDNGVEVILASSKANPGDLSFIENLKNIRYHVIHLQRSSLRFCDDIRTFVDIFLLTRNSRPDFILAYGIKLIIWGGLSAQIFRTQFFALITGVGFAFQGSTLRRRLLTKLVVVLYKIALRKSRSVIFQNTDNYDLFIKKGIVSKSNAFIVNGSGVNIEKFNLEYSLPHIFSFLCIARLLGEKGLREYAMAAKIVKEKFPNVRFILVGPKDPSPDGIPLNEVDSWAEYIDYKGSVTDVRPYIKKSHVYVLPSYHEGLPRSTLEAMSMGRAILTTNAPGCKDTVKEGVNGFKVQVGFVDGLVEKMIWFVNNPIQTRKMGLESRKIVEDKFNVYKVNKEILKIIGNA